MASVRDSFVTSVSPLARKLRRTVNSVLVCDRQRHPRQRVVSRRYETLEAWEEVPNSFENGHARRDQRRWQGKGGVCVMASTRGADITLEWTSWIPAPAIWDPWNGASRPFQVFHSPSRRCRSPYQQPHRPLISTIPDTINLKGVPVRRRSLCVPLAHLLLSCGCWSGRWDEARCLHRA